MTKFIKYLLLTFLIFILLSCSKKEESKNYIPFLRKLHKIECDHIKKAGIKEQFNTAYEFRAAAFQEILKNTDRILLAHYEDLYAELARQEFLMNEKEKKIFYEDIEKEYKINCK